MIERPRRDLDVSWDEFISSAEDNLVIARCVRVEIRRPAGRVSVVLTLSTNEERSREVLCYFTAKEGKGKNSRKECIIAKDSKLAKLYRITIGENPERFNRGKRLAKRLTGVEFKIVPISTGPGSKFEYRTETMQPLEPIKSEEWSETGKSYHVKSPNFGRRKHGVKQGQVRGKEGANEGQGGGKDTLGKADTKLLLEDSYPQYPVTSNQTTYPPNALPVGKEIEGTTVTQIGKKELLSQYHQKLHESEDDYVDRALSESMAQW